MESQIFETIMLICFGMAWPFSIYRVWKTKVSTSKSMFFLVVILLGYISGIFFKIYGNLDKIIYLYIFNTIMVTTDIFLTIRYRGGVFRKKEDTANKEKSQDNVNCK